MQKPSENVLRKYSSEPIHEVDEEAIYTINYSCHMHPISQLTIPDFMDKDKKSMIDTTCTIIYVMLPMTLSFFLNTAASFVSIYFIGVHDNIETFSQIAMGYVVSNLVVYYLIDYLGAGFAIVCTYFSEKDQIGFLYQKTLGVALLLCILATPFMYLSDKFLNLFNFDRELVKHACEYAWGLIPSYYMYAYLVVNKNYLQCQGVIFPPILIHLNSFVLHFFICFLYSSKGRFNIQTAAWIKNITDGICCLTFYFYILIKQPTKQSWIEWNVKAINNVGRYIKEVMFHVAYTYLQAIAFQLLCIVSFWLDYSDITAHFSFAILFITTHFFFTSLSECVNHNIALSIQGNEYEQIRMCKKKVSLGVIFAIFLALIFNIVIIQYRQLVSEIFVLDSQVKQDMKDLLVVFGIAVGVQGLNIVLTGINETLQSAEKGRYTSIVIYGMGLLGTSFYAFYYEYGVFGIWVGWLITLSVLLIINITKLALMDYETSYKKLAEQYVTVKQQIRTSKMQIS